MLAHPFPGSVTVMVEPVPSRFVAPGTGTQSTPLAGQRIETHRRVETQAGDLHLDNRAGHHRAQQRGVGGIAQSLYLNSRKILR